MGLLHFAANYSPLALTISVFVVIASVLVFVLREHSRKQQLQQKVLEEQRSKAAEEQKRKDEEQRKRIEAYIKLSQQTAPKPVEDLDDTNEEDASVNYEAMEYPFDMPDSKWNIVYNADNGASTIKGATVYKLVEKLTEESGKGTSQYTPSFLLTYRSFSTPRQFLELLVKRYSVPFKKKQEDTTTATTNTTTPATSNDSPAQNQGQTESQSQSQGQGQPAQQSTPTTNDGQNTGTGTGTIEQPIVEEEDEKNKAYRKHIQLRVWYVLKYWTENHFYDFEEDESLIHYYDDFLTNVMTKDMEKLAAQLKIILTKQRNKHSVMSFRVLKSEEIPSPILPTTRSGPGGSLYILDLHPLEVARQLTLIEYNFFHKIQPKECLNQCWNKDGKEEQAPNIVQLIDRFNKMSQWVITEIITEKNVQKRAQLMELYITIAEECKSIKNFNSMMGIVSGLMGAAVSRLKQSWAVVPKDVVDRFEKEYSTLFSYNCKLLRDAVKQSCPPCLPYIGTYLADLTFIEDGNPNTVRNGKLINFEKRLMISKVITDLRVYQQREYNWTPVPEIQDFLNYNVTSRKLLDDKESYQQSLEREPRQPKQTN